MEIISKPILQKEILKQKNMAKPILIVKFPISFATNGEVVNIFSDYQLANRIEENFKSKLEGDYHILLSPTTKELISFEVLSIKEDLEPLYFEDLKKYIVDNLNESNKNIG